MSPAPMGGARIGSVGSTSASQPSSAVSTACAEHPSRFHGFKIHRRRESCGRSRAGCGRPASSQLRARVELLRVPVRRLRQHDVDVDRRDDLASAAISPAETSTPAARRALDRRDRTPPAPPAQAAPEVAAQDSQSHAARRPSVEGRHRVCRRAPPKSARRPPRFDVERARHDPATGSAAPRRRSAPRRATVSARRCRTPPPGSGSILPCRFRSRRGPCRVATAAADPPLEPPADRDSSCG